MLLCRSSRWETCTIITIWLSFFCWTAVLMTSVVDASNTAHTGVCNDSQVLTADSGVITDGPNNYPESMHCQWLVVGGQNKFISLVFTEMNTECSYDYLFIYDGNSYNSTLLATYSGQALPHPVLATSGYMLLYFYSDRNYALDGFRAEYQVSDCPYNCNNQGTCEPRTHQCTCDRSWTGVGCMQPKCPSVHGTLCGDHGECSHEEDKCECHPHYSGYGCTLNFFNPAPDTWYLVDPGGAGSFEGRAGHSVVYIHLLNSLYVYGGRTLNGLSRSLMQYSFTENRWYELWREPDDNEDDRVRYPGSRHEQAMVGDSHGFYVYGGIKADGSFSSELWHLKFNISHGTFRWHLLAMDSIVHPPGLAGHTLTLANGWLYLFAGRNSNSIFQSDLYKLNLASPHQWEHVVVRGGRRHNQKLTGHSTVYHHDSQMLIVYGGFTPDYARFPKRSPLLQGFHLNTGVWITLGEADLTPPDPLMPTARAHHTAAIMDNYLVIYGGNAHVHEQEDVCYDERVYFYHLSCHQWVNVSYMRHGDATNTRRTDKSEVGRFSHSSAVARGNTLLIVGGYRGNLLSDLIAYTVPLSVAKNQGDLNFTSSLNHCHLYFLQEPCVHDLECVWCMPDVNTFHECIPKDQQEICHASSIRTSACVGLCSRLHECVACVIHVNNITSTVPGLLQPTSCVWCAQTATCQIEQQSCTNNQDISWWGSEPVVLGDIHGCIHDNVPAGLTWSRYNYPRNSSQPDEVMLISHAEKSFTFTRKLDQEYKHSGVYSATMMGFIHPFMSADNGLQDALLQNTQLYRVIQNGVAQVYLSTDETMENKELIADVNVNAQYNCRRASGNPMFVNYNPGDRYYMEFEIRQNKSKSILQNKTIDLSVTMNLQWNMTNSRAGRVVIKRPYLEPYRSGAQCTTHISCLACMTDLLCGWCETQNSCYKRDEPPTQCDHTHSTLLITQPAQCPLCEDHIDCHSCMEDSLCRWLVSDARCIRYGRFPEAVASIDLCPAPCHVHTNCSSCLSHHNECAWCEETLECFAFNIYMLRYMYGTCTHWVDRLGRQNCHDCSQHTTCATCLTEYQCGWCSETNDPLQGTCMHGDYAGASDRDSCLIQPIPVHSNRALPLAMPIEPTPPTSTVTPTQSTSVHEWSYVTCPDIDECGRHLHTCHANATCTNTPQSYMCQCNRGYEGDGELCNQTCYHSCVHGRCSLAPHYVCHCDLGWTGPACDRDCGCNYHSTCHLGVGTCDECLHNTVGDHCEQCMTHTTLDTVQGHCLPCECNGHADLSQQSCDSLTGICYCVDNTHGDHCEMCDQGYYGDPSNNGNCYQSCTGRTILHNITHGALGSMDLSTPYNYHSYIHCLWILSVGEGFPGSSEELETYGYSSLHSMLTGAYDDSEQVTPTITLSILTNITHSCDYGGIYVYDGIPSFMNDIGVMSSVSLGVFCETTAPITVQAHSGVITLYTEHRTMQQQYLHSYFNATYQVNRCPDLCTGNRQCVRGVCMCATGWKGLKCNQRTCVEDCGEPEGRGVCQESQQRCICSPHYNGSSCSHQVSLPVTLLLHDNLVSTEPRVPEGRTGHTMVDCHGVWYLFGGLVLGEGLYNDLWSYRLNTDQWDRLQSNGQHSAINQPPPRYFHSSVCVGTSMYMYGGLVSEMGPVRELWRYNITENTWQKIAIRKSTETNFHVGSPPKGWDVYSLAGHTMTLVDNKALCIIGGYTGSQFSDLVYLYYILSDRWGTVNAQQPTGLYGHTAVLHQLPNNNDPAVIYLNPGFESRSSIYIYGGILPLHPYAKNKPSSDSSDLHQDEDQTELWVLNLRNAHWSVLSPSTNALVQTNLHQFHVAVSTSDYMIIVGHTEHGTVTQAYSYTCNHWIDLAVPDSLSSMHVSGASAISIEEGDHADIYVWGGYNGLPGDTTTRITVPLDMCMLFTTVEDCWAHPGCDVCSTVTPEGNDTLCFSSTVIHDRCSSGVVFPNAVQCTSERLHSVQCSQYSTCIQCLAYLPAATDTVRHPNVEDQRNKCQWCHTAMYGTCDNLVSECERLVPVQPAVAETMSAKCPENTCRMAKCADCLQQSHCVWAQTYEIDAITPIQGCVPKIWYSVNLRIEDPDNIIPEVTSCPVLCEIHNTCGECMGSNPGGNRQHCAWSETLQQCITTDSIPLQCISGRCGHIVTALYGTCRLPCITYTDCSMCIDVPGCGWCAFSGLNGLGVCMEGGITAPESPGQCSDHGVWLHDLDRQLPAPFSNWSHTATGASWSFVHCPPENECLNGHHHCVDVSEYCTDQPMYYQCNCRDGYEKLPGHEHCMPHCSSPCGNHGVCAEPDKCECDFHWIGAQCDVECECNKHSNCESIDKKKVCVDCQNNTMGGQCERCKPHFVGDSTDGKPCTSCFTFCYEHSTECVELEQVEKYRVNQTIVEHGPHHSDNAECISCDHHTSGKQCQGCQKGYFRTKDSSPTIPCIPCQCNGHSADCDGDSGNHCDCQNNTRTDTDICDSSEDCYKVQCTKCINSYLGTPVNGHQCYCLMAIDNEYCFDPITQMNCVRKPQDLPFGRTVYFSVQPRYLNVDIRITIDVQYGGLTVYFAPSERTFIVDTEPHTGIHQVHFDDSLSYRDDVPHDPPNTHIRQRHVREAPSNTSQTIDNERYLKLEREASELTTFITVYDPRAVLTIKNIQHRLVITLPNNIHALKIAKFYLVLFGTGSSTSSTTKGQLFFRQDQPHIDLFVFFSVFFSCFFLFLAMCVLLWKLKQAHDVRRSRHRRKIEMAHLANRPFASAILMYNDDNYYSEANYNVETSAANNTVHTLPKMSGARNKYQQNILHVTSAANNKYSKLQIGILNNSDSDVSSDNTQHNTDTVSKPVKSNSNVGVLALEPLATNEAAVTTILLQLPGGIHGGSAVLLASCLTQVGRGSNLHGLLQSAPVPNPHAGQSSSTSHRLKTAIHLRNRTGTTTSTV